MKKNLQKLENINRIREAELYKSAAYFFNKYGYSATSVRQIGRAIGIHESSIYHYIRSKEDLLFNICSWAMIVGLDVIAPIAKSDLMPDLKLKKMIDLHTATIAENFNEHLTMLKELRSLSPSNRRKIVKLRDRYEALFRKVIRAGAHERLFRDLDIKMTTLSLLGMMNSLIRWYSPDGPIKSAEIAKIFSALFFNGVRKKM